MDVFFKVLQVSDEMREGPIKWPYNAEIKPVNVGNQQSDASRESKRKALLTTRLLRSNLVVWDMPLFIQRKKGGKQEGIYTHAYHEYEYLCV